jgi:hypothetical protein
MKGKIFASKSSNGNLFQVQYTKKLPKQGNNRDRIGNGKVNFTLKEIRKGPT